ncbi:hypothetical protein RhiirA4_399909 [Rhizophagus irregularis]|uniref:Uncharacterized protein n=1 Tax=Rhizophagus irregularis TaxID=588596 RepID=A0A2I1GCV6_9GLOM|nr:hypothetical protein RhiirA4_399909 [Rhizophagus irregularis]
MVLNLDPVVSLLVSLVLLVVSHVRNRQILNRKFKQLESKGAPFTDYTVQYFL